MSEDHAPLPDFSQPFAVLRACHSRIRLQCDTLRKLVDHLSAHGADPQARQAAAGIMRYFDSAARHHHEDEEDDLLPRMMSAATISRGSRLTRLVADIATEHREMERVWTDLRPVLQEISVGEVTLLDPLDVDRFAKLYHTHMALEESNVIPLAEMLLSKEDVAEIAAAMAQRRGIAL